MTTHHYKIAEGSLDRAIEEATHNGWSASEVLQSILVLAVERHAKATGAQQTRAALEFEITNLSDNVDFDFVRSR